MHARLLTAQISGSLIYTCPAQVTSPYMTFRETTPHPMSTEIVLPYYCGPPSYMVLFPRGFECWIQSGRDSTTHLNRPFVDMLVAVAQICSTPSILRNISMCTDVIRRSAASGAKVPSSCPCTHGSLCYHSTTACISP